MRAHLALLLVGFVLLQHPALAQSADDAAGLEGEALGYELIPPKGWTLDSESGAAQGALAVLYPKGSSWNEAGVRMRVDVVEKEGGQNLNAIMQGDSMRLVAEAPGTLISALPSLRTVDGLDAVIRHRVDAGNGRHEAIAYIDAPEAVVSVTLSAGTEEGFGTALRDFEFLVGSVHISHDAP